MAMAREVNVVCHYLNETSHRAIRERGQFLSGFDLQKLTNGFSKCDGVLIGSPTVQQVCEDYAKARKQFKRAKLRWRVSNPKSSLPGTSTICGTATAWASMSCAPALSVKTAAAAGI